MRVVHCKREAYTHYIGRPGTLGNQHPVNKPCPVPRCDNAVHGRGEAIAEFEKDARADQGLLNRIQALPEDAILGCWCAPNPCHGMVIRQIWLRLNT